MPEAARSAVGDSMQPLHGHSVVVASFNGERWIRAQLASVFGQTVRPGQLVVSDDASSDGTVRAIAELAVPNDVRLCVLLNEVNVGFVRNFERSLRHATGRVSFLCDQDDVWMPSKIAEMSQALSLPTVTLAFSDATVADQNLVPQRRLLAGIDTEVLADPERLAFALLRRNLIPGMTIAARTEFLQSALPVPDGWHHDHWFVSLAAWCGQTTYVRNPLVLYRTHDGQTLGPSDVPASRWRTLIHRFRQGQLNASADLAARGARLVAVVERLESIDEGSARRARSALEALQRLSGGQPTGADVRLVMRVRDPALLLTLTVRLATGLPGRLAGSLRRVPQGGR